MSPACLDPHRAVLSGSCKALLPFCTPWGVGGDFCFFVIPAFAPVLWQLPYCISSCNRLPLRSICQGRASCMFCLGEKGHGMTRSRVPHSFSSNKAQSVFSRSAQSTRGLIEPATLVMVWVSGTLPVTSDLLERIWLCFAAQQMCVRNHYFSCPRRANPAGRQELLKLLWNIPWTKVSPEHGQAKYCFPSGQEVTKARGKKGEWEKTKQNNPPED